MTKAKSNQTAELLTLNTCIERVNHLKTDFERLKNRVTTALGTITSDKPERERLTVEFAAAVMTGDAEKIDSITKEAKTLFPARQKAVSAVDKLEADFDDLEAQRQALIAEAGQLFDSRQLQRSKVFTDIGPGLELNHAQALLDEAASVCGRASHPGTVPGDLKTDLDRLRQIVERPAESATEVKPGRIVPGLYDLRCVRPLETILERFRFGVLNMVKKTAKKKPVAKKARRGRPTTLTVKIRAQLETLWRLSDEHVLTDRQIAEHIGVTHSQLRGWLDRHDDLRALREQSRAGIKIAYLQRLHSLIDKLEADGQYDAAAKHIEWLLEKMFPKDFGTVSQLQIDEPVKIVKLPFKVPENIFENRQNTG